MVWIAFLITLPIPVLAALLVKRVYEHPEKSFEYMALSKDDVENAMRLLMTGFVLQTLLLLYSTFTNSGINLLFGAVVGTATTVTMITSLVILNVAARERKSSYYQLLPSQLKNRFKE